MADDFAFLHGCWTVRHRKLATRLAGASDWVEFAGTSETRPILCGAGNVEDNVLDDPAGPYRAAAVRSWSAAEGLWRIWWLDGRFPDTVGVPLAGAFAEGRGVFEARDVWAGRPVVVRFLWFPDFGAGPRWEQAFSPDGGQDWETNWTMDFRRLAR